MHNGKSRHGIRPLILAALACAAGLAFAAPAAWAGVAHHAADAPLLLADSRCRNCDNRRNGSYDASRNEVVVSGKSEPADPAIPRYDPKPLSPRDEYKLRVFEATQDRLNNPDYNDASSNDAAGGEAPADSQEAKDPKAADGAARDGSQAQAQEGAPAQGGGQDQQKAKGKKKKEEPPPPPEKSGGFKMIVIQPQGGQSVIKPQN